jgi:hypothetical protein
LCVRARASASPTSARIYGTPLPLMPHPLSPKDPNMGVHIPLSRALSRAAVASNRRLRLFPLARALSRAAVSAITINTHQTLPSLSLPPPPRPRPSHTAPESPPQTPADSAPPTPGPVAPEVGTNAYITHTLTRQYLRMYIFFFAHVYHLTQPQEFPLTDSYPPARPPTPQTRKPFILPRPPAHTPPATSRTCTHVITNATTHTHNTHTHTYTDIHGGRCRRGGL